MVSEQIRGLRVIAFRRHSAAPCPFSVDGWRHASLQLQGVGGRCPVFEDHTVIAMRVCVFDGARQALAELVGDLVVVFAQAAELCAQASDGERGHGSNSEFGGTSLLCMQCMGRGENHGGGRVLCKDR